MKIIGGFLAFVGCALFVLWLGVRFYKSDVIWEQNVGGHLKRAADSNTLGLAKTELDVAIKHLEDNGLTSGYTSLFWRTPDEDLGFWYTNLKASSDELSRCIDSCKSQLEQTNVLMKLRETLLDEGQGVNVTTPSGISIYPNNMAYLWWAIISFVVAVLGFVLLGVAFNTYY